MARWKKIVRKSNPLIVWTKKATSKRFRISQTVHVDLSKFDDWQVSGNVLSGASFKKSFLNRTDAMRFARRYMSRKDAGIRLPK